jgi:hypothetical protein
MILIGGLSETVNDIGQEEFTINSMMKFEYRKHLAYYEEHRHLIPDSTTHVFSEGISKSGFLDFL